VRPRNAIKRTTGHGRVERGRTREGWNLRLALALYYCAPVDASLKRGNFDDHSFVSRGMGFFFFLSHSVQSLREQFEHCQASSVRPSALQLNDKRQPHENTTNEVTWSHQNKGCQGKKTGREHGKNKSITHSSLFPQLT
jgi:hypothetical protein